MIDVGDYISEIEVNVYNGNADAMNLLNIMSTFQISKVPLDYNYISKFCKIDNTNIFNYFTDNSVLMLFLL